jgi:phosphatidate cytidylyltransferase
VLVQRVITALILLPLLLAAIFFAPTPLLYALFSAAALAAGWEWSALMGRKGSAQIAYVVFTAVLLGFTWLARGWWPWIMAISAAWWLYATWLLTGFPQNFDGKLPPPGPMAILGQVLFLPTILATAELHAMHDGPFRLIYVFGVVFAADTGAYLAGRAFGKHKLAPAISPGKSVEGAIGGLALVVAWSLTAGVFAFQADDRFEIVELVLLSLLVGFVSIVGDLTESMFKRLAGVKDSGTLLPGHGGALDRIDSLVAAFPVMALGVHLLGW